MTCPYLRQPEPCAKRQAWTTPAPSDCRACDFYGRKATPDDTNPPSPVTKPLRPVTPRPKPVPITPKKEPPVPKKMTTKERVLGIITRRCATGKTPLLQGSKASSDELKVIVAELEREGKIKVWEYRGRAGAMALYTLPGAKDPRAKEMLEGAPRPEKAGPAVPSAPGNGGAETVPRPAKAAGKAGTTPYAAAIADLEARKSAALDDVKKYDAAIETLRALA